MRSSEKSEPSAAEQPPEQRTVRDLAEGLSMSLWGILFIVPIGLVLFTNHC